MAQQKHESQSSQSQEKKKSDKAGGNRRRVQNYWASHNQQRVARRKLRHILQSSGPAQALAWAVARGALELLRKVGNEHGADGRPTGAAVLAAEAFTDKVKAEAKERVVAISIPTPYSGRGSVKVKKAKRGATAPADTE